MSSMVAVRHDEPPAMTQLRLTDPNTGDPYRVEPITFTEAQTLIEARHYLGHLRKSGIQIGLISGAETIGAAVYGQPSREGIVRSLWDQGTLENTVELLRFYTVDGVEPWLGTWFLSRSIKLLPREVEMIVAYSDPHHGHHGGLYQAASWIYTGPTTNTPYHYEDEQGNRVGKQTPWKQARRERDAGTAPNETPAEGERRVAVSRGWTRVNDKPKERYVYPRSKRARRLLRPTPKPYRKPNA